MTLADKHSVASMCSAKTHMQHFFIFLFSCNHNEFIPHFGVDNNGTFCVRDIARTRIVYTFRSEAEYKSWRHRAQKINTSFQKKPLQPWFKTLFPRPICVSMRRRTARSYVAPQTFRRSSNSKSLPISLARCPPVLSITVPQTTFAGVSTSSSITQTRTSPNQGTAVTGIVAAACRTSRR